MSVIFLISSLMEPRMSQSLAVFYMSFVIVLFVLSKLWACIIISILLDPINHTFRMIGINGDKSALREVLVLTQSPGELTCRGGYFHEIGYLWSSVSSTDSPVAPLRLRNLNEATGGTGATGATRATGATGETRFVLLFLPRIGGGNRGNKATGGTKQHIKQDFFFFNFFLPRIGGGNRGNKATEGTRQHGEQGNRGNKATSKTR